MYYELLVGGAKIYEKRNEYIDISTEILPEDDNFFILPMKYVVYHDITLNIYYDCGKQIDSTCIFKIGFEIEYYRDIDGYIILIDSNNIFYR